MLNRMLVSLVVLSTVAACGDTVMPVAPIGTGEIAMAQSDDQGKTVSMFDICDPVSFNAVLGAGTCERKGGHVLTFNDFIAELVATQTVTTWANKPDRFGGHAGEHVVAVNRGGEAHTFTPVANFGGGFVGILNTLSGNPVPAPECLALDNEDFVPPGGKYPVTLTAAGEQHFQCCIHPWMRTTVQTHP